MTNKHIKIAAILAENEYVDEAIEVLKCASLNRYARDMLGFVKDHMQRREPATWRIWGVWAPDSSYRDSTGDAEYDLELEVGSDGSVQVSEWDTPAFSSSVRFSTRNLREVKELLEETYSLTWDLQR